MNTLRTSLRLSQHEFCQLMDTRLRELEKHAEARRRYAAVLAAIRQNLDVYTQETIR